MSFPYSNDSTNRATRIIPLPIDLQEGLGGRMKPRRPGSMTSSENQQTKQRRYSKFISDGVRTGEKIPID